MDTDKLKDDSETPGSKKTEELTAALESIAAQPETLGDERLPKPLHEFEVRIGGESHSYQLGIVGFDSGSRELLTNNPDLLKGFNAKGPAVFDENGGDAFDLVIIDDLGGKFRLSNDYDSQARMTRIEGSDGLLRIAFSDDLAVLRPTQRIEEEASDASVAALNTRNLPRQMVADGMPSYFYRFGYKHVESVRTAIDALGLQVVHNEQGQLSEAQMPTPQTLLGSIGKMRVAYETGDGPYVPNIELLDMGKVNNANFVGVFARGNYPIAANELWYYAHDLATDHFPAMLTYGEPLMELMSQFAQTVQENNSFMFPEISEFYPGGELDGEQKLERAAIMLDRVTQLFGGIDLQVATEDLDLHLEHAPIVEGMMQALRQAGSLEDSLVGRYLLSNNIVGNVDDITTENFINGMLSLVREQHGIVQDEPRRKTVPSPGASVSEYGGFG